MFFASPSENSQYHRVRALIPYLNYGELKNNKILPKNPMFTGIPKGGKFSPLARKIGYAPYGLFMEGVIQSHVNRLNIEDTFQTIPSEIRKEYKFVASDYDDIKNLVQNHFKDRAEAQFGVEWTFDPVQGHPDIVYRDYIYDIKTTGQFNSMRTETILQLLSYYCLGKKLHGDKYTGIGLVLPAQQSILTVDLSKWNYEPFWKALVGCVDLKRQREQLYPVSPDEFMYFIMLERSYCGGHIEKSYLFDMMKKRNRPLQFFVGGRSNSDVKVPDSFRKKLKEMVVKTDGRIYIHAPYTLNPSNRNERETDSKTTPWVVEKIGYLLELGKECGLKGIVIHCGKIGKENEDVALLRMFDTVVLASKYASETCPLLIETSAGQKGELLSKLDDFLSFWLSLPLYTQKRVKVCIDTCHVFAADHNPSEFLRATLSSNVPVGLIHYNDSRMPRGSRKDRHAVIGSGYIGLEPLLQVVTIAAELDIDCVHE